MAKLLTNLKKIDIYDCDVIEEVVSNRDDEDEEVVVSTSTNKTTDLLFHLDLLQLRFLPNLKCIGGGGAMTWSTNETTFNNTTTADQFKLSEVNVASWSLCQYTREIQIDSCEALPYVVPSYAVGQMQKLEKLSIWKCKKLVEVFETQRISTSGCGTTNIDEGSGGPDVTMVIPRLTVINVPQLLNLKELRISGCDLLLYVFTLSTLESLMQLEQLNVRNCQAMNVIVKEEDRDHTLMTSKVVVFPRLKSIRLDDLPNLTAFFLGMNVFQWSLLDYVMIDGCPQMMVFASGRSIAPNLNYIHTVIGKHSLECGLNFNAMPNLNQTSLDSTNSCPATSKEMHWSFHSLIEVHVENNEGLQSQSVFPSDKLLQLQKMEKIEVRYCFIDEVFGTLGGEDISFRSVVKIPNLREVILSSNSKLKYIWKNNPWMVLEFPNLTKLSISWCKSMEHVFTISMVGSLLQLQELEIGYCGCMEVIVKEATVVVEEGEGEGECNDKVNEIIMLPRLKSLTLEWLPRLKGFYLGKEAFSWPSLDTLKIIVCPTMSVFTKGDLATPELRVIDTSLGRCELGREEGLNTFITTKQKEGFFNTTR